MFVPDIPGILPGQLQEGVHRGRQDSLCPDGEIPWWLRRQNLVIYSIYPICNPCMEYESLHLGYLWGKCM